MARPSAGLPDAAPSGGTNVRAASQDRAPTLASTPIVEDPVAAPSSQSGAAHRRTRNTRHTHGTRNASVAPTDLEPSLLASIDVSQLHVETDSSDSDYQATQRPITGPSHSRSMSNPFPSFFSSKKKKGARNESSFGSGDSASGVDGELLFTKKRGGQHDVASSLAPFVARGSGRPSFTNGSCITCGSLMRWARGAEAFRCGICLTVNDLVPVEKILAATYATPSKLQTAASSPISIEHTKHIVTECIRFYLEAVLPVVDINNMSPPHSSRTSQPVVQSDHQAGYLDTKPMEIQQPLHNHYRSPTTELAHSGSLPKSEVFRRRPQPNIDATFSSSAKVSRMETLPSYSAQTSFVEEKKQEEIEAKRIFQALEDYVIGHIISMNSLDGSFVSATHCLNSQDRSGSLFDNQTTATQKETLSATKGSAASERGCKSLFSVATSKNSSWRANIQDHIQPIRGFPRHQDDEVKNKTGVDASRPTDVDWNSVDEWYSVVINAGASWESVYTGLVGEGKCAPQPPVLLREIESCILKGQQHAQRVLLKATETVLKRPGRRIGEAGDFRFLIIALANPLLHAQCSFFTGLLQYDNDSQRQRTETKPGPTRGTGPASGQHSVIIKRILGLLSNSPDKWHSQIITCFARFPKARFLQLKDLVGGFLAYRLVRYNEKKDNSKPTETSDPLVPKVPEGASAASFHAALNQASGTTKASKKLSDKKMVHGDDWQIKAAVRVLRLLFAANDIAGAYQNVSEAPGNVTNASRTSPPGLTKRQIVPTSDFYITLLDNCDLVADFEGWEQQTTKFAFCQYPFLLSVWAKIQILEYEARRQMKSKARDAFFDSIMTRRNFDQHLILNVRRDCLVEDSLKGVSAAIGSGTDDIKKGLRIIFNGEEGIDAGGLRKEWFLLLVREVFNPDHGMFVYDEESHYCYFNPASFETSDQFFLVGVVLGLAIYNSTILDVALPPFAFRKLLFAAPTPITGVLAASSRPIMAYTLADLAEFRPRLARGLQQLLDYDGDVESTFGLEFTIVVERFGQADTMPLCPGGESRTVSNANREEYVNLYVRYLLDTAVFRQFEPFKRGFFTVCGCNALGLFRPEEIELLVRGSDEPLDVAALRLAASYENWPSTSPRETEPTIKWFWDIFRDASPKDQRKLLIFITGSDRIPVTGPASLSIQILCLGEDTGRFPTARTCFNVLTLYRYKSKEIMQTKLWGAVYGSEGFGLK